MGLILNGGIEKDLKRIGARRGAAADADRMEAARGLVVDEGGVGRAGS